MTHRVTSDYDAWANLYRPQHFVENLTAAAAVGINAGLDQEGGGTDAVGKLADAVAANQTSAAAVAQSFRRLFRARLRLGMLDPPEAVQWNRLTIAEECQTEAKVCRTAARTLALRVL